MITGQILVYRYNGLYNAQVGDKRNNFHLKDISVTTKEEFRQAITNSLDEVPPGKGYSLVRWNGRNFVCEKDLNNPSLDYVRHEVSWHPLLNQFSV